MSIEQMPIENEPGEAIVRSPVFLEGVALECRFVLCSRKFKLSVELCVNCALQGTSGGHGTPLPETLTVAKALGLDLGDSIMTGFLAKDAY
jgi:hypothetical protein